MRQSIFWFIVAALMSIWLFGGSARADDPKAMPDKRPRLMAQLGHAAYVTSVSFSPDGKQALTASEDQTAHLWDVETGKELRHFTGHTESVWCAVFSHDGKLLLTGSADRTARLWDNASAKEIRRFTGHSDWIRSVAFSPDDKLVLTGSSDGTARLWNVASGKEIRRFSGHRGWRQFLSVAFSPDGRFVLESSTDSTAHLWDVATGKEIRQFSGKGHDIISAALSPDGKLVLTGSWDNTARLWDAATGNEIRRFIGHTKRIQSVAFSPNGKFVLTGSIDKTVRLWELASAQEIKQFTRKDDYVDSVAFCPDGKFVLAGGTGNAAHLWEVASGKEIRQFTGNSLSVKSASFSPDGKQVLLGSGGAYRHWGNTAHLWDVTSGKEIRRFTEQGDYIESVVFSSDAKFVLTGNGIATDRNAAHLWDTTSGKQLRLFTCGIRESGGSSLGPNGGVTSIAFSPNGKQVLTGSADSTVCLWDVASGKEIRKYAGHTNQVWSVSFSPDGTKVLAGGGFPGPGNGTSRLWDRVTGKDLRQFTVNNAYVKSVAFSPDGKSILAGSSDSRAHLWDIATGKEFCQFIGHTAEVESVAFSPDGEQILTGGLDNTARLWDIATGKERRRFTGPTGGITAVAFSADGTRVLTVSADKTTRLWDAATSRELVRLLSFINGSWAVVDPEGRFDAANGGDVEGLHWVVGNEPIALKQLKERYYDPGLFAKYMGFNKEPLRQVAAFTDVKLFPDVVFDAPAKSDKLNLNLTNRGGGIGKVQVFVNGKEIRADARGSKPDINAKLSILTVDLAGAPVIPGKPNHIKVVTWNAEGYLSSRGFEREWTPAGEADPNPPELYVVVCGVSQYAEPKLNLRFAAKDAEDMARALELAGKRLFGANKVHLTLLSTGDNPKARKPTKENLRKAFEFVRKAKPTDVLVVYLAGHGVALKQGADEYCYLTADARGTDTAALADPAVLASWAVSSSELVDWIKQIPALKQVMLLDTCAAGAAATRLMEHRDLSGDQVRALDRLKDRTGFHVLMGCASDRVSYEASQYSQGLLTYSLLQGMAGAKLREGEYVDVSGLFQYAADEVPNLARGIGGVQKPLVMAPRGTSFDIGRMVESDRKALPLAKPKPLILRPKLSNSEDGDDNLKLASLVRKRLADDSFNTPRGAAVTTVYVDADELAGAVQPAGLYSIDGTKVSVRLVLKQDGQTINKMTVEGSKDDLPGLTAKIVDAMRQGIKEK